MHVFMIREARSCGGTPGHAVWNQGHGICFIYLPEEPGPPRPFPGPVPLEDLTQGHLPGGNRGLPKPAREGNPERKGKTMQSLLIFLLFIGIYVLVQVYILPKMGIST
jgi:hypothetical protein